MKIATWNVNGIRARQGQLLDWLAAEKPDIVCLQEIKASLDQLPFELRDIEGYWSYWHGEKGYSGVALLVVEVAGRRVCRLLASGLRLRAAHRVRDRSPSPLGDVMVASVYVPNGGKDFEAKLRFLERSSPSSPTPRATASCVIFCGDLNVALARARHPSQAAQAEPDRRHGPTSARCSSASFRTAWSTSPARSIPTTTTCSRGGRRGAA